MKDSKNKLTSERITALLKPYSGWIFLSVICALASVAFTLSIPVLFGKAVDAIVDYPDDGFYLFGLTVMIAAFAGFAALCQLIMSLVNNRIVYHIVRDLRAQAIRKIQKLPLSYLDRRKAGDTVSRVISDADAFADGLLLGFSKLFVGAATIAGTLTFMLAENVWIALLVVLLTPLTLLIARFISKRSFDLFRIQARLRGEQTAFVEEAVTGEKTLKAFGRETDETEKFRVINGRLADASRRAAFFSSLTNPTTRFVNSVIYASAALLGIVMIINGSPLTVGGLSAVLSYAGQYAKPFNEISGVLAEFQNSLACAARIFELIYDSPEEPEAVKELGKASGAVALDNVSFSYSKEKPLINGLNIDVKPGERIAIVGPTGCGKTTFINLLMRFYDVESGSINVDGEDIRGFTRHSLRRNYGMVLQDTWIKEDTVKANIAFGRPDASDDEVIAAAKAAHADGFISRLPDGYDTVISEDSGLSQGQKQLICIARVMLCLPPMLILDEATSSIDTRTELKIQDAFSTLMQGRTSFIVAHRLSTVRDADLILMMKNGAVIEQGRHDELLRKNGEYAKMYKSQFDSIDNGEAAE